MTLFFGQCLPALSESGGGAKRKLASAPLHSAPNTVSVRTVRTVPDGKQAPVRRENILRNAYPSSFYQKGLYLKEQGRNSEALLAFIRAVQDNPRDLRSFYEQAKIFKEMNRLKLAKSALEQALSISPDDAQARAFLVALHFESGNLMGAAAEVGKLLSLNQNKKQTQERDLETPGVASSAAALIAAGRTPHSAELDETSKWLQEAAGSAAAGNKVPDRLEEILASAGPEKSETREGQAQQAQDSSSVSALAQVLGGIQGISAPVSAGKSSKANAGVSTQEAQSSGKVTEGRKSAGLLSVVKGKLPGLNMSAKNKESGKDRDGSRSIMASVKYRLPFRSEQKALAVERGEEVRAKKAADSVSVLDRLHFGKPARAAETNLPVADAQKPNAKRGLFDLPRVGWPFAARPEEQPSSEKSENKLLSSIKAAGSRLSPKPAFDWKMPFKPGFQNSSSGSPVVLSGVIGPDGKKRELSPELAGLALKSLRQNTRAERPNFSMPHKGSKVVISRSAAPDSSSGYSGLPANLMQSLKDRIPSAKPSGSSVSESEKAKKVAAEDMRRILASVPKASPPVQSPIPTPSGPQYGLLVNNAFRHIAVSEAPPTEEKEGSRFKNILHQTGKTLGSVLTSVKLPLPPQRGNEQSSAASDVAVVASVPALAPEPTAKKLSSPSNPAPVPLDVTRILSKLSAGASAAALPSPAAPLAPSLSASVPLAASPVSISALIPEPAQAPTRRTALPSAHPTALNSAPVSDLKPKSSPEAVPADLPVLNAFQPALQAVVERTEPLIKPALSAANNLFQMIAVRAKSGTEKQELEPVRQSIAQAPENKVPAPVNVDLEKYYRDLQGYYQKIKAYSDEREKALAALPRPIHPESFMVRSAPALPPSAQGAQAFLSPKAALAAPLPAVSENKTMLRPPESLILSPARNHVPAALAPSALSRSPQEAANPRSAPKEADRELPPPSLPPVLQDAVSKAEPLVKPALDAASHFLESIAPLVIPRSEQESPQPVPQSFSQQGENKVPSPVSGDNKKYYQDLQKYYECIKSYAEAEEKLRKLPRPLPPESLAGLPSPAPAVPSIAAAQNVLTASAGAEPALPPLSHSSDGRAVMPLPETMMQPTAQLASPALISPAGLAANSRAELAPRSLPQESARQDTVPAALPPILQDAVSKAEPLVKPALDAAAHLLESIAPLVIPRSEQLPPEPVQAASLAQAENKVPAPVGRDMQGYYRDLQKYYQGMPALLPEPSPIAESSLIAESSVPARPYIEVQKARSGAFTYMKPVIDSDKGYMLGGKQTRSIQPLPGKPQSPKVAVPEDPLTRRMRYLLEHGNATLRSGEAFMFSEETGEGVLFLPDGRSERRKLQEAQDREKLLEARRPDIVRPQELQYTLSLLGKLLPPQPNPVQSSQPVSGPTLDQLLNQMNQNSKGLWGWMKKSFNLP